MSLSAEALSVVAACHLAELAGKTYAPAPEEWPDAEEARERGWLKRVRRHGKVAYEPTREGHLALQLGTLRRDHPADANWFADSIRAGGRRDRSCRQTLSLTSSRITAES